MRPHVVEPVQSRSTTLWDGFLGFCGSSELRRSIARGGAPSIAWSTGYAWVLVGGQLFDRGFTVEGLTVTYMPRGLGVGHADTVQQRARFFGYKRAYAEMVAVRGLIRKSRARSRGMSAMKKASAQASPRRRALASRSASGSVSSFSIATSSPPAPLSSAWP